MEISLDKLRRFLKEEMKARNISSIREFANVLNITHPTLSRILDESGKHANYRPDLTTLLSIAEATKTDVGWLFSYLVGIEVSHAARVNYIATRIAALPDDKRAVIEELVGIYVRANEGEDDK